MNSSARSIGIAQPSAVGLGARVRWKIQLRIQIPLMILIILSSLDRVNISFAALRMNPSLHISPEDFGFAVGIFFFGYLLFQFPSTLAQRHLGTRLWVFCTAMSWGVVATLMALVENRTQLYVLRFLLGAAESGLAPGIVYYCSCWMPRRYRAEAIATTLLAVPISVVMGGPLSGWLLSLHNPMHVEGWRWMFLIEGLPTVIFAVIAYSLLVDRPEHAKWLTAPEKSWLRDALQAETPSSRAAGKQAVSQVFSNSGVWVVAAVWFSLLLGANGIIFWLPQVLKQMSGQSDLTIGMLSAVPWLGVAVGLVGNAWHSDRHKERLWHVALAALVAAVALALASLSGATLPALLLLFVAGIGIGGAQGTIWALPSQLLSGAALATGITFINLVGNLASLVGPSLIGFFRHKTGSFAVPVYFLAATLVVGALLLLANRRGLRQG